MDDVSVTPRIGAVDITWTASVGAEVTGYSVYRVGRGGDAFERIATLPAEVTTFTDELDEDEVRTLHYAVAPRVAIAEGCLSDFVATDLDGDDISDLFELLNGLPIDEDNSGTDRDGDGIADRDEYFQLTSIDDADSDGDGLADGEERDLGSDPRVVDTDLDGLPDGDEVRLGSDPGDADTDKDRLRDGDEVLEHGSDPLAPDSDEDGLRDGDEVESYGTDPALADTDGDGLDDGSEIDLGTDPLLADTDGEGVDDGVEVALGTNPLDPDSVPEGVGVNRSPIAEIVARPTIGVAPLEVSLDGGGSIDPDGEIVSFVWTFGDGSDGVGLASVHRFFDPGDYTVTLEVTDDDGARSRAEVTIRASSAGFSRIRPGDVNADRRVDISDGIALFGHLFLGEPPVLPCGDGTIQDAGNRELADANGDTRVDLSDGIYLLAFLFSGGSAPTAGTDCIEISGCPQACGP